MNRSLYRARQQIKSAVKSFSIPFVVALSFASVAVNAQQAEIEEVIVEGEAYEVETLDELTSVAALDAEKLADAGIENIEDVAAYVPNLTLTETETGTSICIRGICAGVNQGFDQSVGLFSDRVPLPRANMARSPFLDLAGVQVYRGPQYVLDGNFSIAGSVHMTTDLSTDEFKAGFDFNYIPSQNDRKMLLQFGGPISDSFAAKFVVQSKRSDGYIRNVFLDRDEAQSDDLVSRLVLGFIPSDSVFIKLKAEWGEFKRRGRASEIILDLPTPELDLTSGGVTRAPSPAQATIGSDFLTEADFILSPLGTFFSDESSLDSLADLLYDPNDPNNPVIGDNANFSALRVPVSSKLFGFSGRSFLGKLAETRAIGISPQPPGQLIFNGSVESLISLNRTGTLRGLNEAILATPQQQPLLPGALDDELDFRRSVNIDEFSNNETLNLTLNTDFQLGASQLLFTASFIDYTLDELIDSDHTPYNLVETSQIEDYSQTYFRLDFKSPGDNFIEIETGLAYMDADLEFSDLTLLGINDNDIAANLNSALGNTANNARYRLGEDLRSYLGAIDAGSVFVRNLSGASLERTFEQEQELTSAYLQTTLHWSDAFRTRIGVRYTHSDKSAIRDLALVEDRTRGNFLDTSQFSIADGELQNLLERFALFFGIQLHTDNIDFSSLTSRNIDAFGPPALRGTRREEALLPSFKAEWDLNEYVSAFAAVGLANKLGGFDARSNSTPTSVLGSRIPLGTFEFEDEQAITYELGTTWYLPAGTVKAVAFYTQYEDLQVSRFDGRSGFNVDNAAGATNSGVELEGNLAFNENFGVDFSLAYTTFEFDDFKFGSCNLGTRPDNFFLGTEVVIPDNLVDEELTPGEFYRVLYPGEDFNLAAPAPGSFIAADPGFDISLFSYTSEIFGNAAFCDFSGKTTQFVAEWSGTVTLNYAAEMVSTGLFKTALDILYNSGYETSASQDDLVAQDAYYQLNGRIALSTFEESWEVAITAENITNEKIVTYANDTFGARIQGARGFTGFIRPPRSIGLNIRYTFY